MKFCIHNTQIGIRERALEVVCGWQGQYTDEPFYGYTTLSGERAYEVLAKTSEELKKVEKAVGGNSNDVVDLEIHKWHNSSHAQGVIFWKGQTVFFFSGRRISLYEAETSIIEAFDRLDNGAPSEEKVEVLVYQTSEPGWKWYHWKGWTNNPEQMYYEPPEWAVPER